MQQPGVPIEPEMYPSEVGVKRVRIILFVLENFRSLMRHKCSIHTGMGQSWK